MPELLQEMYYGPNVQNLIESDDCKVMRLSDNSGEGMMTLYHVFPGVFLMYNDFHMKECISGFQTDMDLLCIDHCREGRIEQEVGQNAFGGTDIRRFTCDSLLKNISMVFQNVYLFRDTIKNNIKFGSPDATDEQIIAAAKAARCHDFIMALPDGYDTVIGEGGSSLSGGEKQRISIARAMLKDAPIIILDEATASIDPENEHLIQEAISALTHGKTIITIAHRLATIENADQILVIDGGTVAQRGTHKELLQQEGTYKKFIQIREQAEGWRIQ